MNPLHWLLPEAPDVLGMLRDQAAVTVEGMEALVAWANGSATAADDVRNCEHRADVCKRELREALTVSLMTPLEPEDLFELSKDLDDVMNHAKDTVREAEVMHVSADSAIAEMAGHLAGGARHLVEAFTALPGGGDRAPAKATAAADAAVKSQRRLERAYRHAMSALVDVDDLREVTARREIYRRLARTSDELVEVAERVWYSVLKAT
jgi:uncharacterized protein Yka (UPF0111/DUF47 family)